MGIVDILDERGLLFAATDRDALGALLASGPTTFYAGYDPSGASLHVGSLVPISIQRQLAGAGHRPIGLVGGATGMIGDPSGKSEERTFLTDDELGKNQAALGKQLSHLLGTGVTMVNNHDWTSQMSYLEFLRDVGKRITVNYMLAKDSVKSRLENREQGISYTEFSYMLLQANDFVQLAKRNDCRLQVGGSDQWGNITCGIELGRKSGVKDLHGLVGPLLTTASGAKFGKTAVGTSVWLDAELTSPYQFYQYWINVEDDDVATRLKMFTLLSLDEIGELMTAHETDRGKRNAQRRLAAEVTAWVHSKGAAEAAEEVSRILFGARVTDATPAAALQLLAREVPSSEIARSELESGLPILDALVQSGLAKSKGAARRLAGQGGVYVNNERFPDADGKLGTSHLLAASLLVLRAGKKNYHLLHVR